MKEILILEIQRELQKLKHPSPLAISKEIVLFTKGKKEKIDKILERISKDEPWEHIKGYTYFKGNKILVNKNTLIPRIETEEIVDIVKEKIDKNSQIFDVGTGSGCIAISLSKIFKNKIYAIDVDKKALEIAKKNIKLNNCKNIDLINADLLNFEFDSRKPTVIVANLPYLPSKTIEGLDNSVKKYEPILALDGGERGDELYTKLLEQIKEKDVNLKYAIFEIDPSISKYFGGFEIKKDIFGRNRFVIILPSHLK